MRSEHPAAFAVVRVVLLAWAALMVIGFAAIVLLLLAGTARDLIG